MGAQAIGILWAESISGVVRRRWAKYGPKPEEHAWRFTATDATIRLKKLMPMALPIDSPLWRELGEVCHAAAAARYEQMRWS